MLAKLTFLAAGFLVIGSLAACSSTTATVRHASARPSSNPHTASLAYARCLRQHGVPHPDPDERGNFSLTPAQERKIRRVAPAKREAATMACFHNLAALNNQPLSDHARARAVKVLFQVKRCMHGFGYELGKPFVQNKSLGRAFFGFENVQTGSSAKQRHAQSVCEKRVQLTRKLNKIIAADRRTHRGGL